MELLPLLLRHTFCNKLDCLQFYSNCQLFMMHNDLLYHITFILDNPQLGDACAQMEDIYAMAVNTFQFTE